MNERTRSAGFRPVRRDQLRAERGHDSYQNRQKPPEPAACGDCGALFYGGRWQWGERPADAAGVVCPACRRVRDRFPAGFLHVGGAFLAARRDEIETLLRQRAAREKATHPLARIMAVEEDGDGLLVTTTDLHLARDLGEALQHAYQGALTLHYSDAEMRLRAYWRRD